MGQLASVKFFFCLLTKQLQKISLFSHLLLIFKQNGHMASSNTLNLQHNNKIHTKQAYSGSALSPLFMGYQ